VNALRWGPVVEQRGRCCRLTVSAARTDVALLIRRAVRCSAKRKQVAALRPGLSDATPFILITRPRRG